MKKSFLLFALILIPNSTFPQNLHFGFAAHITGLRFLIHVAVLAIITLALEMGTTATAATTTTSVGQYPIVDTNQSLCYDSSTGNTTPCLGAGYDADYSGNQPSYTVS